MQCVTIKGGFVGKKTEKRVFCYTVLLTNLKNQTFVVIKPL